MATGGTGVEHTLVDTIKKFCAQQHQHMIAAELMNRFTQDTLQLHHQIQMQSKENDVREAHYVIAGAIGSVAVLMLVIAYASHISARKDFQNR